jgi:hypothetical protein
MNLHILERMLRASRFTLSRTIRARAQMNLMQIYCTTSRGLCKTDEQLLRQHAPWNLRRINANCACSHNEQRCDNLANQQFCGDQLPSATEPCALTEQLRRNIDQAGRICTHV